MMCHGHHGDIFSRLGEEVLSVNSWTGSSQGTERRVFPLRSSDFGCRPERVALDSVSFRAKCINLAQ